MTINILPGSTLNPVNLTGSTLPVAVLTTVAGEYGNPLAFDTAAIDATSVRFGSPGVLLQGAGITAVQQRLHVEDALELDEATRDGDPDAILQFRPRNDALAASDTSGCVFGRVASPLESLAFYGCDLVTIVP